MADFTVGWYLIDLCTFNMLKVIYLLILDVCGYCSDLIVDISR